MLPDFERAIAALAGVFALRTGLGAQALGAAAFLKATHAEMPGHLRVSFRVLTLAFDASALPSRGRPFHALSPQQRLTHIEAWERSRLGICRDLMMFYRSFTIFSVYSDIYGVVADG